MRDIDDILTKKANTDNKQKIEDIRVIHQLFIEKTRTASETLSDWLYNLEGQWLDVHGEMGAQIRQSRSASCNKRTAES